MGIWTSTMKIPVGKTGYAITNELGTGITIQPIDPRIFGTQYTSSGSNGSGTKTQTKNSDDDIGNFKATTGVKSDILGMEYKIDAELANLPMKYMDAMGKKGISDQEFARLQSEMQQNMAQLKMQKLGLLVTKNDAEVQLNALNDSKAAAKGKEDEIAFNVNVGQLMDANDWTNKLFDANGTPLHVANMEITPDYKQSRTMSVADYHNAYDRFSGVDENGAVQTFRKPNLNIDNAIEFNTSIKSALNEAGTLESFKLVTPEGMTYLPEFDQNVLTYILNTEEGALFSENSNAANIKTIIDNMWEKIPDSSRAKAYSSVLKSGVFIPTGNMVPVEYNASEEEIEEYEEQTGEALPRQRPEMTIVPGNDALLAYERAMKLYSDALRNDDPKADEYKAEAQKYADAIVNTAKEYVVQKATDNAKGMVNRSFSSKTFGSMKASKSEKEEELGKMSDLEAWMNSSVPHQGAAAVMGDDGKYKYEAFQSGRIEITGQLRNKIATQMGWDFDKNNINKPTLATAGTYVLVNGIAVDIDNFQKKTKRGNDFEYAQITDIGTEALLLPDYIPEATSTSPKGHGIYGDALDITKGYVSARVKLEDGMDIPYVNQTTGKVDWTKYSKMEYDKNPLKFEQLKVKDGHVTMMIPMPGIFTREGEDNYFNYQNAKQAGLNQLRSQMINDYRRDKYQRRESIRLERNNIKNTSINRYLNPEYGYDPKSMLVIPTENGYSRISVVDPSENPAEKLYNDLVKRGIIIKLDVPNFSTNVKAAEEALLMNYSVIENLKELHNNQGDELLDDIMAVIRSKMTGNSDYNPESDNKFTIKYKNPLDIK